MHPSIEQYLEVLHTKRRALETLKVVRQDLTHFVIWWEHTRRTFDQVLLRHEDLRDWRLARQRDDRATPASINRGLASLCVYCQWVTLCHLLTENPTIGIEDVSGDPLAPRLLPAEAIDGLLHAARAEQHALLRMRNEALLALLIYTGLRVQEACNLQLRDLDPAAGIVGVRSGKAGKARRVPFHPDSQRLLHRYLEIVRCPRGVPAIGSDRERELLLMGIDMTMKGQLPRPGITQQVVLDMVQYLGQQAARQLRTEAQQAFKGSASAWVYLPFCHHNNHYLQHPYQYSF